MAQVEALTKELQDLGFWDLCVDGRYRYRYQLTEGSFILTDEMKMQLHDIGSCVAAAQRATLRICEDLGGSQNYSRQKSVLYKAIKASCEGYPLVLQNVGLSPLVKVDLMWDGSAFKIAEIDTYNPRGIAYALWFRHAHVNAGDESAERPAVVNALKEELAGRQLVWLYSERERYYVPIMEAAARVLSENGVSMRVVGEAGLRSVCPSTGTGLLADNEQLLIVPDRMHKNCAARDQVIDFALNHPDRLVVPYAPHMGSKIFLSILTDRGEKNPFVDLLETELSETELGLIDQYIPMAKPLARAFCTEETAAELQHGPASVIKAISSSGTKGVYMPGHPDYESVLVQSMGRKTIGHIAQQCVDQRQLQIGDDLHYVRVTAYVDARNGRCLDAELTGTGNDPLVHGGENCIQLPAIF